MTRERFLDLLTDWVEARDAGKPVDIETLCRDCPELIEPLRQRIAELESLRAAAASSPAPIDNPPPLVPAELPRAEYRARLVASTLLPPPVLQEFESRRANELDDSAATFAGALLRARLLTRYQAHALGQTPVPALVLGNYVILDKLGQGGMAQVFKAWHRRMDRVVALKILHEQSLQAPGALERFQREAQAAARLAHPNIVTAYDADEAHGIHFLVMEYVAGLDLRAYVQRHGPLSFSWAIDCLAQAARGLAYAHEQGVIHRDIKPANLLLDRQGTVRILDLGLARLATTADAAALGELTQDGTILGSVDYMAPEQAVSTRHVDARSDIYSLGCTLHYLLVGRAPFGGDSLMARMLAHRDHPIPQLAACREDVPPELEAIFARCLAKQPHARFATMPALIAALESCRLNLVAGETLSPEQSLWLAASRIGGDSSSTTRDTSPRLPDDTIASGPRDAAERTHAPHRRLWWGIAAAALLAGAPLIATNFLPGKPSPADNSPGDNGALATVDTGDNGDSPSELARDERDVALWALKKGSRIEVFVDGDYFELESPENLPPGQRTYLQSVAFQNGIVVSREDLSQLVGLSRLKSLGLYGVELEQDVAPLLATFSTLENLSLGNTAITNDMLVHIGKLSQLSHLRLGETSIDDAGLSHLHGLSSLRSIDLQLTNVTPAGVEQFRAALPHCREVRY